MPASDRIIVFSLHRSGTMVLYHLCRVLTQRTGHKYFSPNGGDVLLPLLQLAKQPEHWLAQAGCFGPLRIYIPVPRPEDARILLHLRDPRDVLVSMFFSYCYSHSGKVEGGTGFRGEVAERGIDEFVLRMATDDRPPVADDYGTGNHLWHLAGNLRQRYERYVTYLLDRRNTVFVRYEDMLSDRANWLSAVAGVFGIEDSERLAYIEHSLSPLFESDHEDPRAHKRRVAPGDYKRKLRAATISRLDDALGDLLGRLGYHSDPH